MKTNGILAALAACALALLAAGCNNGFTDAALNAMKNNAEQTVPVEGITLNTYRLTLKPGTSTSAPLEATVTPKNATDKKVKWSSSNTKIATVSDNGTVTAVALGTATITAKAGDKETTCTVTVKDILVPVTNVWLNSSWLTLVRGATKQLTAEVYPYNADITAVTWESKNPDIATVDENGTVTAVAIGETIITVTTEEGEHTATCEVTVTPKPVERITLSEEKLSLQIGKARQLTATWEPKDADVTSVSWSTNSYVAEVNDDGTVTAKRKGDATVTVTIQWGSNWWERTTAECAVTVTLPDVGPGFTLDDYGYLTKYDGTDTDVVIPEGVTGISSGAFDGNTDITGVTIPASVTRIEGYAFGECTSLEKVIYTGTLADWCGIEWTSNDANPLKNGHAVLYIGGNPVTVAVIPDGVTEIKDYAFYGYSGLTSVEIPESVTKIGQYAFFECTSLESVRYGGTLAQWCEMNNDGSLMSNAKTVNVDGTNLKDLKNLVIPEGVKSIGYEAFSWCTSLESVEIPDSVESIGDRAFYRCSGLTSVTIPASVTRIESWAFEGCSGLTSVNYGGTDEEWRNNITIDSDSGLSGKTITGKDADGNEAQWTAQ